MTALADILLAGHRHLVSLCDRPICRLKGRQFPCTTSTEKRGTVIEIGGFEETIDMTVYIDCDAESIPLTADSTWVTADATDITADQDETVYTISDRPTIEGDQIPCPAAGDKIAHRNRLYRILNVGRPTPGSHWEIDCGALAK